MCGILGLLAFGELPDKKAEKIRQESMIFLASELLQLTQSRGRDATGISTLFSNMDYMGLKMGIPSADFVSRFGGTEKDFDGYLDIWRKKSSPAKMVLGHCRKSSVGNSEDNVNNHPIKVGDIVGVHNGTLTNHDKIFEMLNCKRDGTVDSEAIFRLLHYFTENGKKPFAPDPIQEVCRRLHGSYACLSFSGNNPYQMIGFRDARPMEILLIKPLKLMVVASEKDFLKHIVFKYNKMAHLYQTSTVKFPPLKKSDVELKSLSDDTLFIFDIRKETNSTTKIEDLYISEKIPRTSKIWDERSTTKTTSYTPPFKGQTRGDSRKTADYYKNKTTVIKKDETKDNKRLGMAWNKDSCSYQNVVGVEESKKYGNVEINGGGSVVDTKTGNILVTKVKTVDNTKVGNKQFKLDQTYQGIDNLIITRAEIKELDVPIEPVDTVDVKLLPVAEIVDGNTAKTEVVLDTYPEALRKSITAVNGEKNFSNVEEVRLALDIDREEDLRSLPLYSLANRIKRFFYKKGWFNGYVGCLHDSEDIKDETVTAKRMLLRINNKRKIAEKNIRTMKSIVNIFDRIANDYEVDMVTIDKSVANDDNKELTIEVIKSIFKPGDLKNAPTLNKIAELIESRK